MSGPNNIRSNQSNQVDPYGEDWLNEGNDAGYAEGDVTDMDGEGYGESGYQDMEGRAPRGMTGTEAAAQIKILYDQIKKNPDIDIKEKNKQLKNLQDLYKQVKSYGSKPIPVSLKNEINSAELEVVSKSNSETIAESGETDDSENAESKTEASGPAAKIAELSGVDASEIAEKAKAKGIDLNKIPKPPTRNFIEFILEINPDLASKFEVAGEKVKARNDDIQPAVDAAKARNSENVKCTSDTDNTDVTVYQKVYDLKYHQDAKSKEAMNAMIDANTGLCDFLNKIDPSYGAVPPSQASGTDWKAFDDGYKNADKITVGGQSIDMFNNSTGALNVGSSDAEPTVEIVTIKFDWEGSGDWEDHGGSPSITKYGSTADIGSVYDNG